MRLINIQTRKLEDFANADVPPYAILSHTWAADGEEVSFQDMQSGRTKGSSIGYSKLVGSCRIAKGDRVGYVWIDTCCIDKSNSTELGEAINSMYRWYKNATRCYAFLSDVSSGNNTSGRGKFESAFVASRWFQRGWTLQELLAPEVLIFYDRFWDQVGSRSSLSSLVEKATRIPRPFLIGAASIEEASIAQRMSWAAKRLTKRPEDLAYSLLGIFGITMPMIYGEGKRAFLRLQEEIMRHNPDDTILAWHFESPASIDGLIRSDLPSPNSALAGVLARSPYEFLQSCSLVHCTNEPPTIKSFHELGGSIRIQAPLYTSPEGETFAVINCQSKEDMDQLIGVPLELLTHDIYLRPAGRPVVLISKSDIITQPSRFQIRKETSMDRAPSFSRENCFLLDDIFDSGLHLVEVHPPERWLEERSLIISTIDPSSIGRQLTWARFRCKPHPSVDLVVILELRTSRGHPATATCHAMVISRTSSLNYQGMSAFETTENFSGHSSATIGAVNYHVGLGQERLGTRVMHSIKIHTTLDAPLPTRNWDVESQALILRQNLLQGMTAVASITDDRKKATMHLEIATSRVDELTRQLGLVEEKIQELQLEKASLTEKLNAAHTYLDLSKRTSGMLDRVSRHKLNTIISTRQRLEKTGSIANGPSSDPSINRRLTFNLLQQSRQEPLKGKEITSVVVEDDAMIREAARTGDVGFLAYSIKEVKALDSSETEGARKPLFIAVENGHTAVVEFLLRQGLDANFRCQVTGFRPLHRASDSTIARLLLSHGAEINSRSNENQSPLTIAAQQHTSADVVTVLLEAGADVDLQDVNHHTPLHHAANRGHLVTAQCLLSNGANTDIESNDENTPLVFAALGRCKGMVELLLNYGANINAGNFKSGTALHFAASLGFLDVVESLLERGADIEAKCSHGQTPLSWAAKNDQTEMARKLIDKGARREAMSDYLETPLFVAARQGHVRTVTSLLDRGALIDTRNQQKATPLFIAAEYGHTDVVRKLLDRGAQPDARDRTGRSPIQAAHENSHEGVISLLESTSVFFFWKKRRNVEAVLQ